MGATQWVHFTPYTPDVAEALQRLRQEGYDRGDYYDPGPSTMTEADFAAEISDYDPEKKAAALAWWRAAEARRLTNGPDSLIPPIIESGTHSIIDMSEGLSDGPELFAASPLTDEQLVQFFSTSQPSSDAVRAWAKRGEFDSVRARWEGVYVVTYLANEPHEICFAGYSGD